MLCSVIGFCLCIEPYGCLTNPDINIVIPKGGFGNTSFPCLEAYIQGIKAEWIPLALSDPGMLDGIFVSVCRSLHSLHGGGPYLEYALRYKLTCLASLNNSISEEGSEPRDASIAKAIILAGDEVILPRLRSFVLDIPVLIETSQVSVGDCLTGLKHIEAARRMILLRGGLAALGTNGFLEGLADPFLCDRKTE